MGKRAAASDEEDYSDEEFDPAAAKPKAKAAKGAQGEKKHKASRLPPSPEKKQPKPKAPKPPTELTALENGWSIQPPSLIFKSNPAAQGGTKIAAVDLDGTLILRKSTNMYGPQDSDDWRWFNADVPAKLAQWHEEGYQLVIFTNQGVIKSATLGAAANKLRELVDKVAAALRERAGRDVPLQLLMATNKDQYRKPERGMWDYFVNHLNAGAQPDLAQSFFVGDAAGRPTDINDGASTDRDFAAAVGLQFKLPEDVFGKAASADSAQACAHGGNAALAAAFFELAALLRAAGDFRKANAFNTVAKVLSEHPDAVTSGKQVAKLKGIGPSSVAKIDEFLQTGTMAAIAELKAGTSAAAGPVDAHAAMALKFL